MRMLLWVEIIFNFYGENILAYCPLLEEFVETGGLLGVSTTPGFGGLCVYSGLGEAADGFCFLLLLLRSQLFIGWGMSGIPEVSTVSPKISDNWPGGRPISSSTSSSD